MQQEQKPVFNYSYSSYTRTNNNPIVNYKSNKHPKKQHRSLNLSLMNPSNQSSLMKRGNSLINPQSYRNHQLEIKKSKNDLKKSRKKHKHSSTQVISNNGKRQIIIDGVAFEFDQTGSKLLKVPKKELSTISTTTIPSNVNNNVNHTPKTFNINGENYVRTKSGNLVRNIFVKKRQNDEMKAKNERLDKMTSMIGAIQKARNNNVNIGKKAVRQNITEDEKVKIGRQRCPTFTKTGRCSKALHCPYVHDSSKTAICLFYLRKRCRNSDDNCPLSHNPSAHNMPLCSHFDTENGCREGQNCLFTHVHLGADAAICRDFAVLGWCDKGKECDMKHVRECPDYALNGDCPNDNCKLPHILKSEASKVGVINERKETENENENESYENVDVNDNDNVDIENYNFNKKRKKNKKKGTDDLFSQSDFVTFDNSDDGNDDSLSDDSLSEDSDQESVESDDFEAANESIPLY